MLKLFLLSTVMTVATTTLTRLYKDVYLPRLGLVKLMQGTGHLGHVLLGLSWVGLFVLLYDRKVT